MASEHRKYLRWSSSSLVLAGYLALASVGNIGPAILIIPLILLPLAPAAERLDEKYTGYGVITRAITIAYCCFLPLSWINLGLMAAVVTLAIYIQCYTLLHKKTSRNYYHLFLMSLFLVLAACVQSPEPIIGPILILFVVSAVWSNILLRIVIEEQNVQRVTDPDLISLDYLQHIGRETASGLPGRSIPAMASLISFVVIVMTAVAFVLTPRMEAGILGRSQTVVQSTGVSDSVDLKSGGNISQDETPVMIVQFPDEADGQIPNPDWLYWRVTTLNTYDENRWSSIDTRLLDPGIPVPGNPRRSERDSLGLERRIRPKMPLIRQSIYTDDVPSMGLPTLDLVQRVRVDGKSRGVELYWGGDNDLTVRLNKSGARRLTYEAWSEPGEPPVEDLQKIPLDYSDVRPVDFETFTEENLGEESVRLARELTEGEDGIYNKVTAVERHLSGPDFIYSLSLPTIEGDAIIDAFITQTRRGHCELFATAMALMLRSQGIVTRVVSGYRGGEWNQSDHSYTIRASMAHLWVEVWFPGEGWVTFDPSPAPDNRERTGIARISSMASRALMKTRMFWFREVVGFDRGAQVDRLRNFTLGIVGGFRDSDASGASSAGSAAQNRSRLVIPLVLFAILAVITLLAILRLRRVRLPRGIDLTIEQIRVVRLYLLLRRRLQQFDVPCAGATAEELRRELESARWEDPGKALRILELYNRVRFGGQPAGAENLGELRKAIAALRPAKL